LKTLNYGLIGCGMMGREHLNNVALLPGINIAAIYEPDEGMAAQALAIAPGAQMAGSVGELLAIEALDALVIASPNHCHAAQLAEIAASRPLPILVEKPLFTDPADAPAIAELNASYGAPIWVAMEYRYMPPIATMVDRVQAATGGPLMLSTANTGSRSCRKSATGTGSTKTPVALWWKNAATSSISCA